MGYAYGKVNMKDVWMQYTFDKENFIRGGYFIHQYGYQSCTSSSFKEHVYRTNAWGHPWLKVGRSLEELFNNLRYGNFKQIGQAMRNRWHILSGTNRYK